MILIAGNSLLANLLDERLPDSLKLDDDAVNNGDIIRIKSIVEDIIPEFIINCHEYSNMDEAEYWRGPAYDINSFFAKSLAEICSENRIKLIYISTSCVFNGKTVTPYKETDTPDPGSFFGDSKLLGERLINKTGCDSLIIRFPYLLEEKIDLNSIPFFIKNPERFTCIKNSTISPVFIEQAADAVKTLLDSKSSGLFHFSQGEHFSAKELLTMIFSYIDLNEGDFPPIKEADYEDFQPIAEFPLFNVLDNSGFISETGVVPEKFSSSLQDVIKKHRNHYLNFI